MYATKQWLIQEFLYEWLSKLFPNSVGCKSLTDYEILLIFSLFITYVLLWLSLFILFAKHLLYILTELDNYFTNKYCDVYTKLRFFIIMILFNIYFIVVSIFFIDFVNFYWYIFNLLTGLS